MPSTSPTAEARRPDGLLIVDGGEPLEGEMGSGCWRFGSGTGCASAGMPVPDPGPQAAPGAACTVAFSDGTPILYGRVSAFPADAADPQAALTVLAVRGDGPVDVPFSFTCPGAGDWVLFASLHAAPGDQTYFWRLLVR